LDEYAVGFLARSPFDECPVCQLHHSKGKCPTENLERYVKWRSSLGFTTGAYLYNYWVARKIVPEVRKLILVESCGNCWKLIENGIDFCVGLFGTKMTYQHEMLIGRLGAIYTLFICLDNDEAGKGATMDIYKRLKRRYNIKIITFNDYNDIGEMPNAVVKDKIISQLGI
jgi:DNA primase